MKKSLFIVAAVSAMVLTGCSKSETIITENDFQQEISFDGFMHKMTKDVVTNADELQSGYTMHVSAIVHGGTTEYFTDKSFTYSSDSWKANPALYWPNNGSLDFLAWIGKSSSVVTAESWTNATSVALTVGNNSSAQEDILFGSALNKSKVSTAVNINVKHAQALVAFQAKTDANNVVVTEISFTPKYSGTCTITTGETPTASWDSGSLANATLTQVLGDSNTKTLTKDEEFADCGAAILLPAQTAVDITVKYTINGVETTKTLEVSASSTPDSWDVNTKYLYKLSISAYEIKFNVVLTDWTTGTVTGDESGVFNL